jgi:hypothetical protein
VRNDAAADACRRLRAVDQPTFAQLNEVIVHTLLGILLPAAGTASPPVRPVSSLANALFPSIPYRLATAASMPGLAPSASEPPSHSWAAVSHHLSQMTVTGSLCEEGVPFNIQPGQPDAVRAIATIVALRGRGAAALAHAAEASRTNAPSFPSPTRSGIGSASSRYPSSDVDFATATSHLARLYNPLLWHPLAPNRAPSVIWSPTGPIGAFRSASVALNSTHILRPLEEVLAKANRLFSAGAFLHSYAAHGVDSEHMQNSLACLEQVAADYRRSQ